MLGFLDNFEQYFESYVLNTQNSFKGALNKVSGLITSKNYENENPETPEVNKRRSKLENSHC